MMEFLKFPFVVLQFPFYTLMTFLMMFVICNIADDTTVYSKHDQASDLCQQLESGSELQYDLQDIVG